MNNEPKKPPYAAVADAAARLSSGYTASPAIDAIARASRDLSRWQESPAIADMARRSKLATAFQQPDSISRLLQTAAAWEGSPTFAGMKGLAELAALRPSDEITKFVQATAAWREPSSAFAGMTGFPKLDAHTSEFIRLSQTLEAWQKAPGIADLTSFSKLAALHAPDAIGRLSQSVAAWQQSPAFAELTGLSKWAAAGNSEFTRLAQAMDTWQKSPLADDINRAMRDLPVWLKPRSFPDALLPSWQIAAGLGAAGAAPAGLIHDVLGALHEVRAETIAFEATVQMAEGIDGTEQHLAEVALSLLRQYTSMLIDLLLSTTDFVRRQGIVATVSLFVSMACLYEAHQQTELAQAAGGTDPAAAIHREITEHLQILEQRVAQLDLASDRNMRVVAQMVPLRLEPHAKAPIIRQLYPDDHVRVQDVKDGWALVEVYEYKSEATTTGWVNRRALRSPR